MSHQTDRPASPPAFPCAGEVYGKPEDTRWTPGMSLRDWFAGQALVGVMANEAILRAAGGAGSSAFFSQMCYQVADAMLAERDR